MKVNIKVLTIGLILLCCFIGTVSAADDVSTDLVSDTIVDDVTVDTIQEEITGSSTIDETSIGGINDDTKADELIENANAALADNDYEGLFDIVNLLYEIDERD